MPNLRERIEEILEQVLMKHHDDISTQDDDAIAEATEQILQVVKEMLPKEIPIPTEPLSPYQATQIETFNSCLAQITNLFSMEEKDDTTHRKID